MYNLGMRDDGRQSYFQLSYIWLRLWTKLVRCQESDVNKLHSALLDDCCNKFFEIRLISPFQLQCTALENINPCPWQPNHSGFLWLTFKSGQVYYESFCQHVIGKCRHQISRTSTFCCRWDDCVTQKFLFRINRCFSPSTNSLNSSSASSSGFPLKFLRKQRFKPWQ